MRMLRMRMRTEGRSDTHTVADPGERNPTMASRKFDNTIFPLQRKHMIIAKKIILAVND